MVPIHIAFNHVVIPKALIVVMLVVSFTESGDEIDSDFDAAEDESDEEEGEEDEKAIAAKEKKNRVSRAAAAAHVPCLPPSMWDLIFPHYQLCIITPGHS